MDHLEPTIKEIILHETLVTGHIIQHVLYVWVMQIHNEASTIWCAYYGHQFSTQCCACNIKHYCCGSNPVRASTLLRKSYTVLVLGFVSRMTDTEHLCPEYWTPNLILDIDQGTYNVGLNSA